MILYACPIEDAGSTIELAFNNAKSSAKVAPGWYPPLIDNQDRVPRKSESIMREFKSLSLGTMHLKKGKGDLTLRALDIPAKSVMEVRSVVLTLKVP